MKSNFNQFQYKHSLAILIMVFTLTQFQNTKESQTLITLDDRSKNESVNQIQLQTNTSHQMTTKGKTLVATIEV